MRSGRLAVSTVSLLVFLAVCLLGWHLLAWSIWGVYSLFDGNWGVVTHQALVRWSDPFDLSAFNPLAGMGSIFPLNTPWLSPHGLVLSLPFSRPVTHFLSMAINVAYLVGSVWLLARMLGRSWGESLVAAQLTVAIVLPPFSGYFVTLEFPGALGMHAHLMAVANLALIAFHWLGRLSLRGNVLALLGLFALVVIGFVGSAFTLLVYVPVYGILGVLLFFFRPDRASLVWKVGAVALLLAIIVVLKVPDFYLGVAATTSRDLVTAAPSLSLGQVWTALVNGLPGFQSCSAWHGTQVHLCSQFPIGNVHLLGPIGAMVAVLFTRGLTRLFASGLLLVFIGEYILAVLFSANLLGKYGVIVAPTYYKVSSYPIYAIFIAYLFFAPFKALETVRTKRFAEILPFLTSRHAILVGLLDGIRERFSVVLTWRYWPHLGALGAGAAVPIFAVWTLLYGPGLSQYDVLRKSAAAGSLPPTTIVDPATNPIIETLIREIQIRPGAPFRGYVASRFAAPGTEMREQIRRSPHLTHHDADKFDPTVFQHSQYYNRIWFGNRFIWMDLWHFDIPTFEEVGQWISKPLFEFSRSALANAGDVHYESYLVTYDIDVDVLQQMGVRFIVTDSELRDSCLTEVESLTLPAGAPAAEPKLAIPTGQTNVLVETPPTIRLYETCNPNLADYSPVQIRQGGTARDTALRIDAGIDLRRTVIVSDELPAGPYVPVADSEMRYLSDGVRVTARSPGRSMLVIPVQYSRCLRVADGSNAPPLGFYRANLVQTVVVFDRALDVDLTMDHGLGGAAACRLSDGEEFTRLGL